MPGKRHGAVMAAQVASDPDNRAGKDAPHPAQISSDPDRSMGAASLAFAGKPGGNHSAATTSAASVWVGARGGAELPTGVTLR